MHIVTTTKLNVVYAEYLSKMSNYMTNIINNSTIIILDRYNNLFVL